MCNIGMMSSEYDPPQHNPSLETDNEIGELLADTIHSVHVIGYELAFVGMHKPNAGLLEISVSAKHFYKPDPDDNPQIPDALFGIPRFDTATLLYAFDAHYDRPALEIRLEKAYNNIATLTRGASDAPGVPFQCQATVDDKSYSLAIAANEVSDLVDQIIEPPEIGIMAQLNGANESASPENDLQNPGRAWTLSNSAVEKHNAQQTYSRCYKFTLPQGDGDTVVTVGIEISAAHDDETDMLIDITTRSDMGIDSDTGELYEQRESLIGQFTFDPSMRHNLDVKIRTKINNQESTARNDPETVRLFHEYITQFTKFIVMGGENTSKGS